MSKRIPAGHLLNCVSAIFCTSDDTACHLADPQEDDPAVRHVIDQMNKSANRAAVHYLHFRSDEEKAESRRIAADLKHRGYRIEENENGIAVHNKKQITLPKYFYVFYNDCDNTDRSNPEDDATEKIVINLRTVTTVVYNRALKKIVVDGVKFSMHADEVHDFMQRWVDAQESLKASRW